MNNIVYSNFKFMNYPEHIHALKARHTLAPVHIRLKPTNRCNHNCSYCAYRVKGLQLGESMKEKDSIPWEKMQETIEDFAQIGVKAVTFSGGGEPLVYKKFNETIELLSRHKIKIGILTNGSLLKGKTASLVGQNATWIRLSIDGWDPESYSQYRQVKKDEFNKILENMRKFSQSFGQFCALGVNINVDKKNAAHVTELCRIMYECGARHIKIAGVVVSNSAEDNNIYHMPLREMVGAQIEEAKKQLESPDFKIINHYHEMTERFNKDYHVCPTILFNPVIAADCCVYSCHDKAYNESGLIGSIQTTSFKNMWFSENTRKKIYSLDPSYTCNHHCVADKKNIMLDELLRLDPEHQDFI